MKRQKWHLVTTWIFLLCLFSISQTFAQEPIRIGILSPLTGAFAGPGHDAVEGIKLSFEELDYKVAGRPVQLFFEDSAAKPDLAVQKTLRLVEREKVQLILGPLSGSEALAVKDVADRIPNVTVVVAGAASENVTMRGIKDNVYRTSYSGAQVMFPFGKHVYEKMGYKKIATLGEDYAFPHTQIGGFIASFLLAGGEVSKRFWVPYATTDYSSIISQIPNDIDAMMVCLGGTDAVNFIKQFKEFGLLGKVKILGGSTFVDPTVLQTAGPLLEGVLSGSHFAQELPYPEFEKYNTAFVGRVGRSSSLFAADYYIASRVAIEAIKGVNGKIEDQKAFRDALIKVKMNTPRGPFEFDKYHNVVLTSYINEVRKVGNEYKNIVLQNFPKATQFGPFDPDWYQSQPSFDRVNPTPETIKNAKFAK